MSNLVINSNDNKESLWKNYLENPNIENRNKIIAEYINLVKFVVGRMHLQLGGTVEIDELISYGNLGLIDAVSKFNLDKGVKFETYASLRIRGAILDFVRQNDWLSRSSRAKQKEWEAAINEVSRIKGDYTLKDIQEYLKMNDEEFKKMCDSICIYEFISLNDDNVKLEILDTNKENMPDKNFEIKALRKHIDNALHSLCEKQRQVIILSYYEELSQKEIATILGVSESRVSQLHSKALANLKIKLGDKFKLFLG